ncbi:MAG: SLC13 family permease, partial [Anaerolineae bacterium]
MTGDIGLVLLILGIAIVLFASERLRVDVVSLMVLLTLLFTGILDTAEAFSGFSNPAVITVWAIYVVSAGLTRTGVADFIGHRILQVAGSDEQRLVTVIMLTVGVMSAFMNNIGATAVLLPAVVAIGRRTRIPVSKLLIPLAFGSLLGGVTTLIGTPPNLLVSAALADAGLDPFTLFDYTPMGLIIMISAVIYMTLVGRRLLPRRANVDTEDLVGEYQVREYLTELKVLSKSPLLGKTVAESDLGEVYDLTVVGLIHDGEVRLGLLSDWPIAEGDLLLTRGPVQQLLDSHRQIGLAIEPHVKLSDLALTSPDATVAEVVISQKADFVGKALRDIKFRTHYGLTVLAIWRQEAPIHGRLDTAPLKLGDTLLVHGARERIEALPRDESFLLLGSVPLEQRRLKKAPVAVAIFLLMIGLVATGALHISAAAVTAMILLVISGAIRMDEAYQSIEWQSVFLIAGMLPMGVAMEKTGTAQFLADIIITSAGRLGPQGVMVGLFILTTIITEFM